MTNGMESKIEANKDRIQQLDYELKLRDQKITSLEIALKHESREKDKIYITFDKYLSIAAFSPYKDKLNQYTDKLDKYSTTVIMAVIGAILALVLNSSIKW